ncbi:MAG TPA: hypothetical protein DIU35_14555 [Candidatus Latescibacteria bacterium]|nr:hypothetical protein [Candidatus Latescibacterota bacterium]
MPDIVYPSINVHGEQREVPATLTGFPLGLPAVVRPDVANDSLTLADAWTCIQTASLRRIVLSASSMTRNDSRRCLTRHSEGDDASRIIRTAVRDVDRFIGSAPRTDDVTVLVLKRGPDGQDTNTQ